MKDPRGEVWRMCQEFPLYEISNHGRVRSYYRGRWGTRKKDNLRILKTGRCRDQYRHVTLVRNKRKHTLLIQVLVAGAFLGPPPTGCRVIHLDGDRSNNSLKNLAYRNRSFKK